jgi:hypothetical protein
VHTATGNRQGAHKLPAAPPERHTKNTATDGMHEQGIWTASAHIGRAPTRRCHGKPIAWEVGSRAPQRPEARQAARTARSSRVCEPYPIPPALSVVLTASKLGTTSAPRRHYCPRARRARYTVYEHQSIATRQRRWVPGGGLTACFGRQRLVSQGCGEREHRCTAAGKRQ